MAQRLFARTYVALFLALAVLPAAAHTRPVAERGSGALSDVPTARVVVTLYGVSTSSDIKNNHTLSGRMTPASMSVKDLNMKEVVNSRAILADVALGQSSAGQAGVTTIIPAVSPRDIFRNAPPSAYCPSMKSTPLKATESQSATTRLR